MTKFIVTVKYSQYHDIFLEAENEEMAREKADEMDGNDFPEIDDSYEIIDVREDNG